jgi:catechol 2,3-dioxygenase-like lactoylglutathione lyase family enzyme
MALKRLDNVGIVVENLEGAIGFFAELGMTLEGRIPVEGEWAGRVTGLPGLCAAHNASRSHHGSWKRRLEAPLENSARLGHGPDRAGPSIFLPSAPAVTLTQRLRLLRGDSALYSSGNTT